MQPSPNGTRTTLKFASTTSAASLQETEYAELSVMYSKALIARVRLRATFIAPGALNVRVESETMLRVKVPVVDLPPEEVNSTLKVPVPVAPVAAVAA